MANEPRLTQVLIDGEDVTTYVVKWTLGEKLESLFRTGTVLLKNTFSNAITYEEFSLIGKTIEISRGVVSPTEEIIFRGYVRKVEEQRGLVQVTFEDKLSVVKYIVVNRSFEWNTDAEAGVISEMFKTLINEYAGLVADNSSVVNSGTTNILRYFRLRQRVLVDGLQELASSLNWQMYYDVQTDKVVFEPKGYRTSALKLSVGQQILRVPKWDFDSTELFNKITIIGQPQGTIVEEGPYLLDGSKPGWSTTSIVLLNTPIDVQVFADTSATPTTERRIGVPGNTLVYDYIVDKFLNTLTWNTSTYAPTTSTYVKIRYTTQQTIEVTRKRQESIDLYTGGEPKHVTRTREDIQSKQDAISLADSQLNIYSVPFRAISDIPVNAGQSLQVGVVHTFEDALQGYTFELQIKEIEMTYPYRYDVISATDKEKRLADWDINIGQRLRKLEEQQSQGTELITTVNDYSNTIDIAPRFLEKYWRVTSQQSTMDRALPIDLFDNIVLGPTVAYDSLWDLVVWSEDGSQINAGYWQEIFNSPPALVYRFPGNNYYEEFVRDNYFYDSANSTGVTWNTTTNTISITDTLESKAVVYGVPIKSVFVTFGSITGNYEVYVSADDKATWQQITSFGVRVLLTNVTNHLYYRIVATSGTVTVTNTYKSGGEINMGAINILVEEQ